MMQKIIRQKSGFTIVELIIVVIVIAILAAVVTLAYNGATKHAVEVSMQSDLTQAASALEIDRQHGGYPNSASDANGGKGLLSSGANVLTYVKKPYGYCITTANARTTKTFFQNSLSSHIEEGNCDGLVSTLAGSSDGGQVDGSGSSARFGDIMAINNDASGNIFLLDQYRNQDNILMSKIRRVASNGAVTTLASDITDPETGMSSWFGGASLSSPGVSIATDGTVYALIASYGGSPASIRKVSSSGVATTLVTAPSSDDSWQAVAVDSRQSVMVLQRMGVVGDPNDYLGFDYKMLKVNSAGTIISAVSISTTRNAASCERSQMNNIKDFSVGLDGQLYLLDQVTSAGYRCPRTISPNGLMASVTVNGIVDGRDINSPWTSANVGIVAVDMAVSKSGQAYLANGPNIKTIVDGKYTTLAGSETSDGQDSTDGTLANARFSNATLLTVDTNSILYVADAHRLRKVIQ